MRSLQPCNALLAIALVLLFAAPAAAASLDAAQSAGQVGERIDGYVGLVSPNAPDDVKALVESVNAGRKAKYAEIAAKNGTTVQAVAALAGQKLVERTPTGQYVLYADGVWKKK